MHLCGAMSLYGIPDVSVYLCIHPHLEKMLLLEYVVMDFRNTWTQ